MNSNNNLDKYFKQAQKAENPHLFFTDDEIRSITDKGNQVGKSNPIINFWKLLKRNKIMSSIITVLICTSIWFTFPDQEQNNYELKITNYEFGNKLSVNDDKIPAANNDQVQKINNSGDKSLLRRDRLDYSREKDTLENLDNPDSFPLLKLTDTELEKIGLKKVGLNYEFVVEHTMIDKTYGEYFNEVINAGYNSDSKETLVRTKYVIDTNGTKREVIQNNGLTIDNASKIVPYGYMTNNYSQYLNEYGNMGRGVFYLNPFCQDKYRQFLGRELYDYIHSNLSFRDYELQNRSYLRLNKSDYPVLRKLIPVFTHNGPKNYGADVILWYLPTKEFMDSLPERYKSIISKKYNEIENFIFTEEMKRLKPIDENGKPMTEFTLSQDWGGVTYYFDPDEDFVKNLDKVKNDSVKIGKIKLDVEDLRKIRFNLKKSIMKYDPPSQDILTYQNDSAKFEILLRKSTDRAAGNQSEVAKVQLYGMICRLFAYDIKGMEEIELNDNELLKLGISSNKNGYYTFRDVRYDLDIERQPESQYKIQGFDKKEVYLTKTGVDLFNSGYDTTIRKAYYRNKLNLGIRNLDENLLTYNGWDIFDYIKVHPIAITVYVNVKSKDGIITRQLPPLLMGLESTPILISVDSMVDNFKWNEKSFSSMLNKFIPIKLNISNEIESSGGLNNYAYTLWYVLNEDLIKALPERYRKSLRKELELLTDIESGSIPSEAACKQMENETSFLDLCRLESSSFKEVQLFPNPVSNKEFTVKFNLLKDCNVRINIHEVSGKFIQNLTDKQMQSGEKELKLLVGEMVSRGVYLLSLTNNKGEQVVRRLIVE